MNSGLARRLPWPMDTGLLLVVGFLVSWCLCLSFLLGACSYVVWSVTGAWILPTLLLAAMGNAWLNTGLKNERWAEEQEDVAMRWHLGALLTFHLAWSVTTPELFRQALRLFPGGSHPLGVVLAGVPALWIAVEIDGWATSIYQDVRLRRWRPSDEECRGAVEILASPEDLAELAADLRETTARLRPFPEYNTHFHAPAATRDPRLDPELTIYPCSFKEKLLIEVEGGRCSVVGDLACLDRLAEFLKRCSEGDATDSRIDSSLDFVANDNARWLRFVLER